MSDMRLSVILQAVDRLTKPLKSVMRTTEKAGRAAKRAQGNLDRLDRSAAGAAGFGRFEKTIRRASRALKDHEYRLKVINRLNAKMAATQASRDKLKGKMMGAAGMAIGFALPIRAAIKFESVMADVKKVVNFGSADEAKAFGNEITNMSLRMPMAAEGIAQIVAQAGQAGIARTELLRFAEDATRMSIAFEMSAEESGSVMTGLRTIFKLNQDQVISLADAVNHLSNNMDATAPKMVRVLNRAGSTAKMFGLTGEQTSALAATMLSLKVPVEVAGTGINALLMKLATADKQGATFQTALSDIGLDASSLKESIGNDAQGALLDFLEAVNQSEDKMGVLSDLFGMEYADDVTKLVSNLDGYRKALAMTADQTGYLGSMMKEYIERSGTTENNLTLMINAVNALAKGLGSAFLPALNAVLGIIAPIVGWLARLTTEFPIQTGVLMTAVGGLIALRVALLAGKFALLSFRLGLFGGHVWLIKFASSAWMMATRALPLLITGIRAVGVAMMTTPIGLIVGGIALAAGLIIANWETVKSFFLTIWEPIRPYWEKFAGWVSKIWNAISAPFKAIGGMLGFGGSDGPVSRAANIVKPARQAAASVVVGTAAAISPASGSAPAAQPTTIQITINAAPGQDVEAIGREVQRVLERDGRRALHD